MLHLLPRTAGLQCQHPCFLQSFWQNRCGSEYDYAFETLKLNTCVCFFNLKPYNVLALHLLTAPQN